MSDLYSNLMPDAQLLAGAKAAFKQAYAPFSRFRVGAALRTPDGQVYFGANVENSSFGLTRCAEQSAVQAMATAGERQFMDIVVYSEAEPPASPCGACRQRIREFAGPDTPIHAAGPGGVARSFTLAELLPESFGPETLGE